MTEVEEIPPRRSFLARHRVLTVILGTLAVIFAYRFFAIYRYWPDRCGLRRSSPVIINRADAKGAPASRETISVASYNIQGHAALVREDHLTRIGETLVASKADIIALNEVHRWTWQNRFNDQLADLARMTRMNVVYAPSFSLFGGQFGNAIFTRGKIVEAKVYDLPTVGEPRTLLAATVQIDGVTMNLHVTHVAAWGKLNRDVRKKQLDCVARHVSRQHPSILFGDLNAPHEAEEIGSLAVNSRLLNASPKAATHRVMEQAIDYVMVTPGTKIRASRVLEEGPSDHRAVLVELERVALTQAPHIEESH